MDYKSTPDEMHQCKGVVDIQDLATDPALFIQTFAISFQVLHTARQGTASKSF